MKPLSRRAFLRNSAALAAVPAISAVPGLARAADFTFKCGHDLPVTHPVHLRLQAASKRIASATKGRFDLQVFGDGQLGRVADMFTQVRTGGIDMALIPDVVIATLVPVVSINAVGFAFADQNAAFSAMDGELGAYVCKNITQAGLVVLNRIWENGFRQVTSGTHPIRTPEDFHGFKIRVPVSPLVVSMFKALGAGPAALNLSEVYTALQTKVVDGQENPLTTIYSSKFYEVQKYCSMTNHQWNGDWMLISPSSWSGVPDDIRKIVTHEVNQSAVDLRGDVDKLNHSLTQTLTQHGMVFNNTDPEAFRAKLKASGFYAQWHKKFGDEAWGILAKYAKDLA
jgi:tripartite ATP-independent transporter DctP family solute receptor